MRHTWPFSPNPDQSVLNTSPINPQIHYYRVLTCLDRPGPVFASKRWLVERTLKLSALVIVETLEEERTGL